MRQNSFKQKVLALVLTIAAFMMGQSAWATTKTVTYTLGREDVQLTQYWTLTHSGDTPFDGTTTVQHQQESNKTQATFNLPDGFTFTFTWGGAHIMGVGSSGSISYFMCQIANVSFSLDWNFTNRYVTNVSVTDQDGTASTLINGGTAFTSVTSSEQGSVNYTLATGAPFIKLVITYSDAPALSIFESDGENAYKIKSKDDLRHLANYVNNGKNDCDGLTFRQTDDITCDNTYTPIGYYASNNDQAWFKGTYDGQGNTVSGITVTRTGSSEASGYLGLFGCIYDGTVQNVVLANSTFTGKNYVGGIVGVSHHSNIINCRVESTVTINAGANNADYHGGIAGIHYQSNSRDIIGCVSAATVSNNGKSGCNSYGGIVGYLNNHTNVKNCLYIGSTVEADNYKGAIVGNYSSGFIKNNYYTAIDLGGVGADGSSSDRDGVRRARTVTLGENIVLVGDETAYNLSGLTAIGSGNYALSYNDGSTTTLYSGEGQTLTFSYTGAAPAEGYTIMLYVNGVQTTDNGNGTFTATMPAADAEVTISTIVTPWAGSGTPDDPWIIQYPSQLILLASNVNGGNNYEGKYFLQTADLIFDGSENNYISVGDSDHPFKGNYNGSGKTISRINIRKTYNSNNPSNSMSVGLFGRLDNGGVVDGIYLKHSTVIGFARVGGIVGWNKGGSVTNCAVESDVTVNGKGISSTTRRIDIGGVVGVLDGGVIDNCFSAATVGESSSSGQNYGGIVGHFKSGNLRNCQVVGATINGSAAGAVVGYLKSDGSLSHNYYNACTVNETTTNIGCGYPPGYINKIRDITKDDGAVQTAGIPLLDHSSNYYVINTYNGEANQNYTLAGRTLYKDGDWNTLCLPFNVTLAGSPLEGATLMELDIDAGTYEHVTGLDNGILYLNFKAATAIEAGKPYIIKWNNTAGNIQNPVFTGVTIDNDDSQMNWTTKEGNVTFKSTYSSVTFDSEDKSVLFLGDNNTLYYPEAGATIGAFRSYFQLDSPAAVKEFRLSFGEEDEVNGVSEVNASLEVNDNSWYTLDGRKLQVKPTKRGMYINNGRKIVIK